jgi:5,6-dimethylbenzimidazole synthase
VGWVSIFNQAALQAALDIPKGITPIAYLCVGYVSHFFAKPELDAAGWLPRLPIEDLVFFDQWGQRDDGQPLVRQLMRDQAAVQATACSASRQSTTG